MCHIKSGTIPAMGFIIICLLSLGFVASKPSSNGISKKEFNDLASPLVIDSRKDTSTEKNLEENLREYPKFLELTDLPKSAKSPTIGEEVRSHRLEDKTSPPSKGEHSRFRRSPGHGFWRFPGNRNRINYKIFHNEMPNIGDERNHILVYEMTTSRLINPDLYPRPLLPVGGDSMETLKPPTLREGIFSTSNVITPQDNPIPIDSKTSIGRIGNELQISQPENPLSVNQVIRPGQPPIVLIQQAPTRSDKKQGVLVDAKQDSIQILTDTDTEKPKTEMHGHASKHSAEPEQGFLILIDSNNSTELKLPESKTFTIENLLSPYQGNGTDNISTEKSSRKYLPTVQAQTLLHLSELPETPTITTSSPHHDFNTPDWHRVEKWRLNHEPKIIGEKGFRIQLRAFLWKLLQNQNYNPRIIMWRDRETGVFKIVDTEAVSRLWGIYRNKKNKNDKMKDSALNHRIREMVTMTRLQRKA